MEKQYIVQSNDIDERKIFYDYLVSNGFNPIENFKQQNFVNNHFPFVIEHDKSFWICESVTCCAAAASSGAIITIDEYFNIIKKNNSELVLKLNIIKKNYKF